MKTITRYLLIMLVISLCSAGCKRGPKYSVEYLDSLKTTFSTLNAAVDSSWKTMINEDDEKILFLKKMLEEVSGKQKFNTADGIALITRLNALSDARYSRQSMADSNRIDAYDSLTIGLMEDADAYLHAWPGFSRDKDLSYLDSCVKKMDENVLLQRINYDSHAKLLNQFVKNNSEALKKIDPQAGYTPVPLFELNPDVN
jgi:hypothetical protein